MAKHIDLSGLKKQPMKKHTSPKVEEVITAIHKTKAAYPEPEPEEQYEPIKRVTLDLPASLHTRLKLRAVHSQTTIRNFVIALLEDALAD
jgi:predicted HicB family RNase H-like nuclease